MRRFNKVVAVSKPILEELKGAGISEQKLAFIPNGSLLRNFCLHRPVIANSSLVIHSFLELLAAKWEAKGVDLLLNAMARVSPLAECTRLLIAGDGPKLEEYQRMAERLRIGHKVLFRDTAIPCPSFTLR